MHLLRLEWQQLCSGYAVLLGDYAQSMAVLAAALRYTPMTAAAARKAAAMLGLARTCSAVVHAQGQCLQRCLGMLLWHRPRLNGSSDVWAGADALSLGAHSRQCLWAFVGPLLWHWLRLEGQQLCFRLRCFAWILRTVDGSARSGAQAHCDGVCCSSNSSSNDWTGLDALSFCALSRAVLVAMLRHAAMHWLRLEWQQRCLGWR